MGNIKSCLPVTRDDNSGRGVNCGSLIHNLHLSADRRSQVGQDLAEYALLIALIALVVIVAISLLGTQIYALYASIIAAWP